MPNEYLIERLKGIQSQLMAAHLAGVPMSSASKGRERETLISEFLSQVMPPHVRFGTGEIIDHRGERSGQLDIVIEHPVLPSFPAVHSTPRLYFAEGVAAVIEVKSDLLKQWDEVEETAMKLHKVKCQRRQLQTGPMYQRIPLFAVGYTGWKEMHDFSNRMGPDSHVHGGLVIDGGLFVSHSTPSLDLRYATGALALWGLIVFLHDMLQAEEEASGAFDLWRYVSDGGKPKGLR